MAAAKKQTDEGKTKTVKVKALQVVSARPGFRRAGIAFGKEPTTIKVSDLTKEQIKQLKDEPQLAISEVEIETEVVDEQADREE